MSSIVTLRKFNSPVLLTLLGLRRVNVDTTGLKLLSVAQARVSSELGSFLTNAAKSDGLCNPIVMLVNTNIIEVEIHYGSWELVLRHYIPSENKKTRT